MIADPQSAPGGDRRAHGRFLRVAAHELRTPLACIRAYAEEMLEDAEPPLALAQREALGSILRNAARLETLVEDMLLMLRLDTGLAELEPATLDLFALVRETAAVEAAHGAAIEVGGEAAVIDADPRLLRRAVRALLRSAVAASPPGTAVQLRVSSIAEGVRLDVRDRGDPGSADTLGSGVELAIARSVADAHGARLELRQGDGAGTSVALVLPHP